MQYLRITWTGLILLIISGFMVSCEENVPRVHFNISDDYSGFFIIKAGEGGQTLSTELKVDVTEATVLVDDVSVFHDWHRVTASRFNGRVLSTAFEDTGGNLMLKSVSANSEGNHLFLVGTVQDMEWYRANSHLYIKGVDRVNEALKQHKEDKIKGRLDP